jgi:hypothetical protein
MDQGLRCGREGDWPKQAALNLDTLQGSPGGCDQMRSLIFFLVAFSGVAQAASIDGEWCDGASRRFRIEDPTPPSGQG